MVHAFVVSFVSYCHLVVFSPNVKWLFGRLLYHVYEF